MRNSLIILCFLSLTWVNLISGRSVDQDVSSKNESRLEEVEKLNVEYKERLDLYEKSRCQRHENFNDIYIVRVPGIEPFAAPCESRIEDGGWTVIQRRLEGNINFQRSWNEYREGFGDLRGDFFIGLEKLHRMTTAHTQELLVFYERSLLETKQEMYRNFLIGSEQEEYVLKSAKSNGLLGFRGNIGKKFSTYDRDNDEYWLDNCAKIYNGGWWFGKCIPEVVASNPNGPYLPEVTSKSRGIVFAGFKGIRAVQMMIRPQRKEDKKDPFGLKWE
ncbi:angiopoietin-related protein 2-like isoform X3 [Drosophila albomicans]|uniref:Angiopoietin-related protein 2-like isoform X3 n=1 Tax=Drosophila albomicans TaxID=7291 RepID=A0A6P8WA47_DROAB|nr:angiopoietin-related protein 2-like isoform X3 [Drosophila albomicans]